MKVKMQDNPRKLSCKSALEQKETVREKTDFSDTDYSFLKTKSALRERIKELTCLYNITRQVMKNLNSPEAVFQGIVTWLPPAWQYPEITVGKITVGDKVYSTSSFKKAHHRLVSKIFVNGATKGSVEIIYTKKMPNADEGPFLREERNLIDAVAEHIALIIERQEIENEKDILQKQLMHADRLATIGQLAAGIAHELNEPLGNILGFAQLARKTLNLPSQAENDILKIETASLYAREIVKKLLFFAKQTPIIKAKLNLNEMIIEGLYLFQGRCEKEGIEIIKQLEPDLRDVIADAGQMNQVLVNLVVNAIQAMPQGGRLTVKTAVEKEVVLLCVEDTGDGIKKEDMERLFLPFFTTKEQGTGLGLSVVHGIVTSHSGTVVVKSKPNAGTSFTVRLPSCA
jgi:signal transduction histidine kinase